MPWIEPVGDDYYRLSSLLDNTSNEVFQEEEIIKLHENIGLVILKCQNLTLREATSLLMHSLISRSTNLTPIVINSIINVPHKSWSIMANHLDFFVHVGINPTIDLFPDKSILNVMFRHMQFKIALETDNERAKLISELWLEEIEKVGIDEVIVLQKFMYYAETLSSIKYEIGPKKLIHSLVEFAELIEENSHLLESVSTITYPGFDDGSPEEIDVITFMFGLTSSRCKSIEYFDEMIGELDQLPKTIRNRMLRIFNVIEVEARNLVNAVWLSENKKDAPDWEKCIKMLETLIEKSLSWKCDPLAVAASRSIAVIYDEKLRDHQKALEKLEAANEMGISNTYVLDDSKAIILYHQKQYRQALEILKEVIKQWKHVPSTHDYGPTYSCRLAAICSWHLKDWASVSKYFSMAQEMSASLKDELLEVSFLCDFAHAKWMEGAKKVSLYLFKDALDKLEKLEDPYENLMAFSLIKRVGQILITMRAGFHPESKKDHIYELYPGTCSNTDYPEEILQIPKTPISFLWDFLLDIESNLCIKPDIFDSVKQRLKNSPYPLVRYFVTKLNCRYVIRFVNTEAAIGAYEEYIKSVDLVRQSQELNLEPWHILEDDALKQGSLSHDLTFFASILFGLFHSGGLYEELLNQWNDQSKSNPDLMTVSSWIEMLKALIEKDTYELIAIMKSNAEPDDRRLTAAILVSNKDISPDELFLAHALITILYSNSAWAEDVGVYMAGIFRNSWLDIIKYPAILINPKESIPALEEACNHHSNGIKKAQRIVLAANSAVSATIPAEYIKKFKDSVGEGIN